MPRYIDADALLKAMDTWDKFGFSHSGAFVREPENDDYVPYVHYDDMVKCVEGMQTDDVLEKVIDELTREISERLIQFLEANYEIIPKQPVVRCKDCKHLVRSEGVCKVLSNNYEPPVYVDDDDFCSRGERSEDEN